MSPFKLGTEINTLPEEAAMLPPEGNRHQIIQQITNLRNRSNIDEQTLIWGARKLTEKIQEVPQASRATHQ